jgi:hypothetical protein
MKDTRLHVDTSVMETKHVFSHGTSNKRRCIKWNIYIYTMYIYIYHPYKCI